jgi:hypothetical protein
VSTKGTPGRSAVFISHAAGDRRDARLAQRLAAGLRERGVGVWIAPDDIPAGEEWHAELISAVLERCTHFLVLLSAASTRSPWVLEEVALARDRYERRGDLTILPLAVGTLGEFANAAFLRRFQEVVYRDDFHAQLAEVTAALGAGPGLPDTTAAIVADKTRDFVGRAHVFAAIDRFLAANASGYFTVEGDPGVGKSAILAAFVQRTGCIAHFNVRAQGIDTARQFLDGVSRQLIARFGLVHTTLPPDALDSGAFLARLLTEAAMALDQGERLVIAVDALDEVDQRDQRGNILFLPPTLPDGVFILLTRRRVAVALSVSSPQGVFDLMRHLEEGMDDVRTYLHHMVGVRAGLRAWIDAEGLDPDSFVAKMAALSEGNFMYLRHVVPDIEHGRYSGLDIDHLPVGLQGYYEDHWRRMGMTARPLPRVRIRIVYVLAEARRAVSRRLIARIAADADLAVTELDVQQVLDDWTEFLHEQTADGTRVYSVYHASFQDFLHRRDVVQAAGVTLTGIDALIADNLWRDLFGDTVP